MNREPRFAATWIRSLIVIAPPSSRPVGGLRRGAPMPACLCGPWRPTRPSGRSVAAPRRARRCGRAGRPRPRHRRARRSVTDADRGTDHRGIDEARADRRAVQQGDRGTGRQPGRRGHAGRATAPAHRRAGQGDRAGQRAGRPGLPGRRAGSGRSAPVRRRPRHVGRPPGDDGSAVHSGACPNLVLRRQRRPDSRRNRPRRPS